MMSPLGPFLRARLDDTIATLRLAYHAPRLARSPEVEAEWEIVQAHVAELERKVSG